MFTKVKETFRKASPVFREYPVVLLMAFFGALSFMLSADRQLHNSEFIFLKSGLVSCLGISVMFALNMLSQRIGKKNLLEIGGVVFLILFYNILPADEKNFTEQYAFLLIPTFILSHLMVSFIAFFGDKREMNFWQYNKNLFINIFLTAIFTGVLVGGVELAILAIDRLFDFSFDGIYYLQTFFLLAIFGSCFIFLLFNEKGLQDLEKNGSYPVILQFFTQYILIPLLMIYVVILYFYAIKIVIHWELPRGWVSYLVLAYSIVGILGLLLVHPLKETSTKSWVQIFSKIFYYTLIPLIALLFTAIFTRILEYGYTEPRYFVLLLAIWLTFVVFYFAFFRRTTIKFIPVSLFAFGLFSLVFPYFNTFSVAIRSQKAELQTILMDQKLLQNGKINFNAAINSTVVTEISDKFKFLAQRKEELFIINFIDDNTQRQVKNDIDKGNFYGVQEDIRKQFKNITFNTPHDNSDLDSKSIYLHSNNEPIAISGYRYLFKVNNSKSNEFTFENNRVSLNLNENGTKNGQFTIIFNNQRISFYEDIENIFKHAKRGETTVDELSVTKKIGGYEFRILFGGITLLNKTAKHHQYIFDSEPVIILIK